MMVSPSSAAASSPMNNNDAPPGPTTAAMAEEQQKSSSAAPISSSSSNSILRTILSRGFTSLSHQRQGQQLRSTPDHGGGGGGANSSIQRPASSDRLQLLQSQQSQQQLHQQPGGPSSGSGGDGGFDAASSSSSAQPPPSVTVNFIDPSSTDSQQSQPQPHQSSRRLKGGTVPSGSGTDAKSRGHDLYAKLQTTFARDYASTLHGVPYRNLRTGASESIDTLLVKCSLPGGMGGGGDALSAWGGKAQASAGPVSDPGEWHTGPYCHVYLAACRDLDHYRAKVRPALQAFVSQIEGAGSGHIDSHHKDGRVVSGLKGKGGKGPMVTKKGTSGHIPGSKHDHRMASQAAQIAAGTVGGGNYSSQYLIVYVPIGGGRRADGTVSGGGGGSGHGGGGGGGADSGGGADGDHADDASHAHAHATPEQEKGGLGLRARMARARNVAAQAERAGTMPIPTASASSAPVEDVSIASSQATGTTADATTSLVGETDDDTTITDGRSVASSVPAAPSSGGAPNLLGSPGFEAAAAPPPGPIIHSSKLEKDLHKKFTVDFPNGRTVILSTLLESTTSAAAACSPLKNQEWKTLLQALGAAIVAGFKERAVRYDEELRRLNTLRAAAASGGKGPDAQTFDLGHFFLIKESLAFTYEQMQLPGEALLQYEELGAIVPEGRWSGLDGVPLSLSEGDDNASVGSGTSACSTGSNGAVADADSFGGVASLALSGDTAGFRRKIRKTKELTPALAHLVHQYLFAREVCLLFRMENPVEVIRRTHEFISDMYRMRLERVAAGNADAATVPSSSLLSGGGHVTDDRARAEAEAWALASCWDVKCSTDGYFSFSVDSAALLSEEEEEGKELGRDGGPAGGEAGAPAPPIAYPSPSAADGTVSIRSLADHGPGLSEVIRDPYQAEEERDAACQLGDLLSFARLRLLRLGDVELSVPNPIRAASVDRPADACEPWVPWEDLSHKWLDKKSGGSSSGGGGGGNVSDDDIDLPPSLDNLNIDGGSAIAAATTAVSTKTKSGMSLRYLSPWLRGAFGSPEAFTKKYLELSAAIVALNEHSGRYRFAARLLGERAEILILQGDYAKAAYTLLSIVDVFAHDQWDGAYYWRLYRLASCQRMTGEAASYLNTLTRCFNHRLTAVAPPQTASLLQRDLEAVVGEKEVRQYRLGIAPFLETELTVEPTPGGKQAQPLGFLRKKLVRHFCYVGETVKASLAVTSHLPRTITVDGIRLFLLTSDRYEAVHRVARGLIEEEDCYRVLSIQGPVNVEPGENILKFDWTPMTVGQYILATVEIEWKEASFFYDSAALRRPIQSVEVMPSEPTQTIELNPLFLIPGHVQQVRLVFHPGKDIIKEGSVELICSEGLKVIPPGTEVSDDAWCDRCSVPLGPCGPNSDEIVLRTSVKSESMKRDSSALESPSRQQQQQHYQSEDANVQTMQARVVTSYYHALYDGLTSEGEESDPMTTLLEAMVTTLDRPALTVSRSDAYAYEEDHVMVSVSLHCNTPVPFFLKEWDIRLRAPLSVTEDGDLNKGMFGHAVAEGEELFFGFKCIRSSDKAGKIDDRAANDEEPILHVILQDEFGKTFRQVLPLDLNNFYEQLRKEDEYASLNTASAELRCSTVEGVVGAPVNFTFEVDLSSLATLKKRGSVASDSPRGLTSLSSQPLLYAILCNEADWILGGMVQGVVDRKDGSNSFTLEFVGIPTRSGLVKRFPELVLEYESTSSPPITVHMRYPDFFKSLSYTHHCALACTTMLEV